MIPVENRVKQTRAPAVRKKKGWQQASREGHKIKTYFQSLIPVTILMARALVDRDALLSISVTVLRATVLA